MSSKTTKKPAKGNVFTRVNTWLGNYLPVKRIYYTLLVIYLSNATNDIVLPENSFIRHNYLAHIVIIFILSFLSIDLGKTQLLGSKILSAIIITFVFYLITRPEKYDIFSKRFYFGIKHENVPKAK